MSGSFGRRRFGVQRNLARPVQVEPAPSRESGDEPADAKTDVIIDFEGEYEAARPAGIPEDVWRQTFPADYSALVRLAGLNYLNGVRPMRDCAVQALEQLKCQSLDALDPTGLRFEIHASLEGCDLMEKQWPPARVWQETLDAIKAIRSCEPPKGGTHPDAVRLRRALPQASRALFSDAELLETAIRLSPPPIVLDMASGRWLPDDFEDEAF